MTDETTPAPGPFAAALANLRDVAPMLREAHHLEPEAQRALADVVEELVRVIDQAPPTTPTANLAERSAQLLEALHHPHHPGLLTSAKGKLADAATWAEAEAPMATGLARRLIDTLAGLGI